MKTPNLNALAAKSVLFEHAFCQISVCAPSRMSFMVGFFSSFFIAVDFPLSDNVLMRGADGAAAGHVWSLEFHRHCSAQHLGYPWTLQGPRFCFPFFCHSAHFRFLFMSPSHRFACSLSYLYSNASLLACILQSARFFDL